MHSQALLINTQQTSLHHSYEMASSPVLCAQVETVVGVHNAASSAINITVLAGSLNNAKAFSQHFQNFTAQVHHRRLLLTCVAWMLSALPGKRAARHGRRHDTCVKICVLAADNDCVQDVWPRSCFNVRQH